MSLPRPDDRRQTADQYEARLRVIAAVRIVSEWPDDPDALDAAARLLYRARRLVLGRVA